MLHHDFTRDSNEQFELNNVFHTYVFKTVFILQIDTQVHIVWLQFSRSKSQISLSNPSASPYTEINRIV